MVDVDKIIKRFRDNTDFLYEEFETVYGIKSLIIKNGRMADMKPLKASYRDKGLSVNIRDEIYRKNGICRAHAIVDGENVFYGINSEHIDEIDYSELSLNYISNLDIYFDLKKDNLQVYSVHEPLEDENNVEKVNECFKYIYHKVIDEGTEFT